MYTVYIDSEPVQSFPRKSCAEAYVAQWRNFYGNRIYFTE